MKRLLVAASLALATAACAQLSVEQHAKGSGHGKPCAGGVGMCFTGGTYPASYLAEGGIPDKGSDGTADGGK